ncbi:MAG: hydrogenase subunit MbhD domain-containing protein [Desulfofustis sp.]|nr:hydrogenase subunit MbhD domain-containing protein [Desulfofustis sp.]
MTPGLLLLFDLLLPAVLLWLAWRSLTSSDLFRAVILFIAFSLLLALAWVRMEAPDVALAEAAIGAGVTGALLLVALARIESAAGRRLSPSARWRSAALVLTGTALLAAAAGLLWSLRLLPTMPGGLGPLVDRHLAESGVDHPVTAVLLNFRGYDTLLEVGVLLLAAIAIWCLDEAVPFLQQPLESQLLTGFNRMMLPILLLSSGYLLWLGSHAPGGAFQAASLLAAGMLLALFSGASLPAQWSGLPLRLLLVLGFFAFLAAAIIGPLTGRALLHYPPAWEKPLILLVEWLLTLSIALILTAAVIGGRPTGSRLYPPPSSPSAEGRRQ